MRVVVVDNHDSFTHNIVHAICAAGAVCRLVANDAVSAASLTAEAATGRIDGVVLSAGPCTPAEAGICLPLIRSWVDAALPVPLLGICLGHQAIAVALGGRVVRASAAVHGRSVAIHHDARGCLAALLSPVAVARYNSLVVDLATLPTELEAAAWDEDGALMALRHRRLPIEGVQFHPESWLCPEASPLFDRWVASLALARPGAVVQVGPP
jgi:anthranilate synthase component 2